jgi:Zn-dependent alcohol dehydrogenase
MIYEDVPLPSLVPVSSGTRSCRGRWPQACVDTRGQKCATAQPLPLVLDADLSSIVAAVGADVTSFNAGDDV